ncbi:MAG: hypothetical protein IKJ58_04140 [Akkermansia sp.]|nr:hypothetical protein [Akkermansia sp.]
MKEDKHLDTLSAEERNALAICGITKDAQLRKIPLSSILTDVSMAAENFPAEMAALPEQRIEEIYQLCNQEEVIDSEEKRPVLSDRIDDIAQRRIPTLVLARRGSSKKSRSSSTSRTSKELHNKSHCIHCARPIRIYFSAWFTLLFYLDLVAWIVLPLLFLLELLPVVSAKLIIAALVAGLLPFFFVARGARCSVCNINIFILRSFSESQYAHKLPLLNRNISTALHIILFLWYRCPGCGTPQHILRRSRRR